jgi:hypothetical protein
VVDGEWGKDPAGWTTAREVTAYSPRGQELENKDALGLYSAATFGYHGNFATAVAKNARYEEVGFDGFEESLPTDCADRHFRFDIPSSAVSDTAHTGRHSIRVSESSPLSFSNGLPWGCPETPCGGLALTIVPDTLDSLFEWQVTATGGAGPYVFSTDILSGDPLFAPTMAGGLGISNVTNSMVQITVTDANGCIVTESFEP